MAPNGETFAGYLVALPVDKARSAWVERRADWAGLGKNGRVEGLEDKGAVSLGCGFRIAEGWDWICAVSNCGSLHCAALRSRLTM